MTLLYRIRAFRRWLFRRDEIERAIDDDLEDYIERSAAEKIGAGMPEAEALRAARIELGGVEQTKERVRAKLTFDPIEVTSRDARHALRTMRRQKTFTAMAVLCLALGIAAPTALFSAFHAVLLDALPVPEPERLVNLTAPGPKIRQTRSRGPDDWVFSSPTFRELESRQTALAGLAAHQRFEANIASGSGSISGTGLLVSGSYFSVLRLQPALGRFIAPADEPRIDESAVAVLSHAYWRNQLNGDPNVVGATITVSGHPLTVIGVAPAGFTGTMLGFEPNVFVPLTMRGYMEPRTRELGWRDHEDPFSYWLYVFGRLHDGGTLEAAASRLNTLFGVVRGPGYLPEGSITDENRDEHQQRRIVLEPGFRGQSPGRMEVAQPLTVLLGLSLLVLLVVCMNVANLMLARGASRKGEMAVRASIGASRGRLVRQLLTEAGVLAAVGGLLSLPAAALLLEGLPRIMPEWFGPLDLTLSVPALSFATATTLATVLLFALAPALAGTRTDPVLVIKGHSMQSVGSRHAMRFRRGLAVVQVACSLAFLVMAGLFAASLANVARVDLGMNVDSVVAFNVSPRLSGYSPEETSQLYDRIEEALAAEPGVTSVSSSTVRLFAGGQVRGGIAVEGFTPPDGYAFTPGGPLPDWPGWQWVSPRFFDTLSIPFLLGRDFTDADRADAPRVAIVSESFVEKYGLGPDPIGKRVGGSATALDTEIVGVVADAKYTSITRETAAQLFRPRRQSDEDVEGTTFYVRAALPPDALLQAVPRVLRQLAPSLPVTSLTTVRSAARDSVTLERSLALLAGSVAALTTLFAALGLYGVLAYSVRERTRELGLRLALGASPSGLRAMVLRQLAVMASLGSVIGIASALGVGRIAEALLFGVSGSDPRVLAGAVIVLAVVVGAAGYLPAARAARVAPMEALRYE